MGRLGTVTASALQSGKIRLETVQKRTRKLTLKTALLSFQQDSLFRNSIYLMLSTLVQGGLGFFFWLLCAHLYTPAKIGLASTLISAMTLISYLSLLGFNSSFIRFLPTSKQKNEKINTGLVLVVICAAVLASGYVLGINHIAPKVGFIRQSWPMGLGFILLVAAAALNLLTDSVFIAYRSAKYNLLIYTITSVVKIVLPVTFLWLGAYGVFAAQGSAAFLGLVLSLYLMAKEFAFRLRPQVHRDVLAKVWHFSSGNYVANLLNIAPAMLMPLIVINRLGATDAGYFYLAFMLVNLLYAIAYSVTQSLFAEGSYEHATVSTLVKRSAKFLGMVMIPASLALALIGPFVLGLFGDSYAGKAGVIVSILAAAGPFVALYALSTVQLKISKQTYALVFVNLLYGASIVGLGLVWARRGTAWVAAAWLVGNIITSIVSFSYATLSSKRDATARSLDL